MNDLKPQFIDAMLMHVPFGGWSDQSFADAAGDLDLPLAQARVMFPKGAVDVALAFHARGDAAMVAAIAAQDLSQMRYRDRVVFALRRRLDLMEAEKEAVRRAAALFALPIHTAEGAEAMWHTVDSVWVALGDASDDVNWYTKRLSLMGVYGATLLYWLGDDSQGHAATWDFLDRRIKGVMQFEKLKSALRATPVLKPFLAGPEWVAAQIKAPKPNAPHNLPGRWPGAHR
jgi:ubiquinone biosynthesis protein COQ9